MTSRHLNNVHWKEIIDYDTFWTLMFSVVVLGAWMFALFSICIVFDSAEQHNSPVTGNSGHRGRRDRAAILVCLVHNFSGDPPPASGPNLASARPSRLRRLVPSRDDPFRLVKCPKTRPRRVQS
jgi:hypothetical protein